MCENTLKPNFNHLPFDFGFVLIFSPGHYCILTNSLYCRVALFLALFNRFVSWSRSFSLFLSPFLHSVVLFFFSPLYFLFLRACEHSKLALATSRAYLHTLCSCAKAKMFGELQCFPEQHLPTTTHH